MATSRNWCFTINNPSSEEDKIQDWEEKNSARYCVWQMEKGEDGTPHAQGYLCVNPSKSLGFMKRNYNSRAHWEIRKAPSHQAAIDYCRKEETRIAGPWEWGEKPQEHGVVKSAAGPQALLDCVEHLKNGGKFEDLYETQLQCMSRNSKFLKEYNLTLKNKQRNWQTNVKVYWGDTGTGKSRRALHEAGENAYWMKKPARTQGVFFDGYDAHENVVIDEFYGWIPWDVLLRMIDRYPMHVDTKGGMVNFCPKNIWITSNKNPYSWYGNIQDDSPLRRRLTAPIGEIVYMNEQWEPPADPVVGEKRKEYDSDEEESHTELEERPAGGILDCDDEILSSADHSYRPLDNIGSEPSAWAPPVVAREERGTSDEMSATDAFGVDTIDFDEAIKNFITEVKNN